MSSATLAPDRHTFRSLVADVAARAKDRLPQAVNGRVESAVKLVLQGDVLFCDDGTIEVGSSDPTRYYRLVGTTCTCTDFVQGKAPEGWCKHRVAAGILKRVQELLPPALAETPAEAIGAATVAPAALPEAPASVNCHVLIEGRQVQVTLRDTDETRLLERLTALLKQYPQPAAQPPSQQPEPGKGWCRKHQVQMQRNEKNGRQWFSHRNADGSWCQGR